MRRWPHLTRIVAVPFGFNILGLLEFFAWIGIPAVMTNDSLPEWLPLALMCVVMIAIVAFDLWWRPGQPESGTWGNWFSPYTGGCFFFLPGWLLPTVALFGMVIIWIWVFIKWI
jgi:hypothetical protein